MTSGNESNGPVQVAQPGVRINGIGLCCAAGNQPFALFAASAAGLSLASPDPVNEALSPDGTRLVPALTCPASPDTDADPDTRLFELAALALDDLLSSSVTPANAGEREIRLLLPPAESERGCRLDPDDWAIRLREAVGLPEAVTIQIDHAQESILDTLREAALRVRNREVARMVFGAVDSLLDPLTVVELQQARRLMPEQGMGGIVPGEAAVFIELEADDGKGNNLALLDAIATAPEPDAERVEEVAVAGLASAIAALDADAGNIDCIVHGLAVEPARQLEWHYTRNRLWPLRLDEAQRQAMQTGELDAPQPETNAEPEMLDPAHTLGATGIAEPLVGIAVACARFGFDWPLIDTALVVETGRQPVRAACRLRRAGTAEQSTGMERRASAA